MRKVIPMGKKAVSAEAREDARLRVFAVFQCLAVLAPDADDATRSRLATEILLMCDRKDRHVRVTSELLAELISVHSVCVYDQQGKCPLTIFTKPLSWELNQAMGLGTETDKGFRRVDETCAAKPLGECHFDEEETDGDVRRGNRDGHEG